MTPRIHRWVLLLLCALLPHCIIGTWPTPEETGGQPSAQPTTNLSVEPCDGLDNNVDGTVDEGCACNAIARGCVAVVNGQCGFGVQWCTNNIWQACTDAGPPLTPVRTPSITVESVSPATLVRDVTVNAEVQVRVTTRCEGMRAPQVDVLLAASQPVMRVRGVAFDGALALDVAVDERYTSELPLPFGPGVPAQSLTVTASVVLGGSTLATQTTVPLEVP